MPLYTLTLADFEFYGADRGSALRSARGNAIELARVGRDAEADAIAAAYETETGESIAQDLIDVRANPGLHQNGQEIKGGHHADNR